MLKEILSISGKPGLFKLINNTANALIVESLLDGKRFPAYSNAKIIALEDISIYTEDEDMPLKTVFKRMYEKEEGKPAINHKESSAAITNYIESVIPEYDADRVYVSDMRKMIQWYNLLLDKNLLNFDEPEEEKKVIDTRLIVECGDVAKLSMLFSELQDRGFKCELKE